MVEVQTMKRWGHRLIVGSLSVSMALTIWSELPALLPKSTQSRFLTAEGVQTAGRLLQKKAYGTMKDEMSAAENYQQSEPCFWPNDTRFDQKKEDQNPPLPSGAYKCQASTCEGHMEKKTYWDQCTPFDDRPDVDNQTDGCVCAQDFATVKDAVKRAKAAANAATGEGIGGKLAVQCCLALFYWFLYVKGPHRVVMHERAWIPPHLKKKWYGGDIFGCTGDCPGSCINGIFFIPRTATTWWLHGMVKGGPCEGWLFAWLQALVCMPFLFYLGSKRRAEIAQKYSIPGEEQTATTMATWCCCAPCAAIQEAVHTDKHLGFKTSIFLARDPPPYMGDARIILETPSKGKMELKGRNAEWNKGFQGSSFQGPLKTDVANLHGAKDFNGDMTGKVIMVSRGEVSFTVKAQNASNVQAAALLVFNEKAEQELPTMPCDYDKQGPSVPTVCISNEHVEEILTWMEAAQAKGEDIKCEVQVGIQIENDKQKEEFLDNVNHVSGAVKNDLPKFFLVKGATITKGGSCGESDEVKDLIAQLKQAKPPLTVMFTTNEERKAPVQEAIGGIIMGGQNITPS